MEHFHFRHERETVSEPSSNVETPVTGTFAATPDSSQGDERDSLIDRLKREIEDLKNGNKDVPQPKTVEPVSETDLSNVDLDRAVPEAQKKASARPLLAHAVDDKGRPQYPTTEDGAPDMREPGIHQNPVNFVHLADGSVVKVAGAIPTYIHDAENGLLKVIAAHPMLDEDGRQLVSGLIKEL
jgi:hypothetical protein